jgi:hypothetical protein
MSARGGDTTHGPNEQWRVYISGRTSCAAATTIVKAVLDGHAHLHSGRGAADSFFDLRGWRCGIVTMGAQGCSTPAHRPFRAGALALNCKYGLSGQGCPEKIPASYVP